MRLFMYDAMQVGKVKHLSISRMMITPSFRFQKLSFSFHVVYKMV